MGSLISSMEILDQDKNFPFCVEQGVKNASTSLQVKWISIFWGSQTHPLLLSWASLKFLQSGQKTVTALNSEEAAPSHHLLEEDVARKTTRKKAWNTEQHIASD